jgi:hypothetical protein
MAFQSQGKGKTAHRPAHRIAPNKMTLGNLQKEAVGGSYLKKLLVAPQKPI